MSTAAAYISGATQEEEPKCPICKKRANHAPDSSSSVPILNTNAFGGRRESDDGERSQIRVLLLLPFIRSNASVPDVRSAREGVTGQRVDMKTMTSAFGDCVLYYTETHKQTNLARRNELGIIIGRNPAAGTVRI